MLQCISKRVQVLFVRKKHEMKSLTIAFLLLTSLVANSQSWFISDSKVWSQVRYGSTPGFPYTSTYIKMNGDTTLNQTDYTKVYKSASEGMQSWSLEGYIRETDTGTVYYQDKLQESESLLYDFGWQIGERIPSELYEDTYFYLDSIEVLPFGIFQDSLKHYYISTGGKYLEEVWIEGIGSLHGVLSNLDFVLWVGEYRELLCFTENDSLKYMNEAFNTCYFDNTGEEDHPIQEVNIEYNENSIRVHLPSKNQGAFECRLFDLNGREMLGTIITKSMEFNIDISSLSCGVYIIQIKGIDFHASKKILIQ